MTSNISNIFFVYACRDHLRQALNCLMENHMPLMYAFNDGPRTPDDVARHGLLGVPPQLEMDFPDGKNV
jgi:hypothetical protein